MRWRDGASRRGTIYTGFNPKIDMLAWTACRLCGNPLKAEKWQVVAVGPHPRYPAAIERHKAGLEYAATTTMCHARCVEAATDDELDHWARTGVHWGTGASV